MGTTAVSAEQNEILQPDDGKATVRLILADSQAIFRAGLRRVNPSDKVVDWAYAAKAAVVASCRNSRRFIQGLRRARLKECPVFYPRCAYKSCFLDN